MFSKGNVGQRALFQERNPRRIKPITLRPRRVWEMVSAVKVRSDLAFISAFAGAAPAPKRQGPRPLDRSGGLLCLMIQVLV